MSRTRSRTFPSWRLLSPPGSRGCEHDSHRTHQKAGISKLRSRVTPPSPSVTGVLLRPGCFVGGELLVHAVTQGPENDLLHGDFPEHSHYPRPTEPPQRAASDARSELNRTRCEPRTAETVEVHVRVSEASPGPPPTSRWRPVRPGREEGAGQLRASARVQIRGPARPLSCPQRSSDALSGRHPSPTVLTSHARGGG